MIQTLTDQTLTTHGLSEDKVIETHVDANKYMQRLKFRGKTTSLYYRDPKLQVLDEKLSMKLVKDSRITMEDYKQDEEIHLDS